MIPRMNYPRINQYRHLLRAGRRAMLAVVLGGCGALLALATLASTWWFAATGAPVAAIGDFIVLGSLTTGVVAGSAYMLLGVRRGTALAARNRIGAESEDYVTATLEVLSRDGWSRRGSMNWPGVGDIDNALLSPDGEVAFAVETKTRVYLWEHLQRVYEQATWLCRRHRCRGGAVPVLVPARERGLERLERGVLVVSPDRLVPALRTAYETARSMAP
jgi:hypothetical protein